MPLDRVNEGPREVGARGPRRRHMVFRVGPMQYAVDVRHVKQTLRAADHPESAVVVHGNSYSRVDARSLFGLEASAARDRMLLAVETPAPRAALVVDAVDGLVSIAERETFPLPATLNGAERQWFEGLARVGSGVVALIRPDPLLRAGASTALPAPDAGA